MSELKLEFTFSYIKTVFVFTDGIQHQTVQSMDHLITAATESWFYLERFACHSTIISYLSRKKDLKEALEYCLNHK